MARARAPRLAFAAVLAAVVVFGWQQLFFECDDAYINFRYVSNHMLGRGWTWNPEPFLPVEGYTAPLWLWVLRGVWTATGVEPPVAAQWITMLASLGTLVLAWRMLVRLAVPTPLSAFALLAIATQRVFLTWTSSGLETGLFGLLFVSWVYCASARRDVHRVLPTFALAGTAALVALARPDGLLCVAATGALLAWRFARGGEGRLRLLAGALPLLAVPAHLFWRKAKYGEWLPNTYFAKHSSWWPESGARYAGSWIVENGAWFWLGLALLWLVVAGVRARRALGAAFVHRNVGLLAVVATLLAHFAYYSFAIGGDIFEYRVYAHLCAPLAVSAAFFCAQLFRWTWLATLVFALFVVATHAFSWLHFADEERLEDYVPAACRGVLAEYRSWQAWLHERMVGLRRHRHDFFVEHLRATLPTRAEGAQIAWDEAKPIYVGTAAGVVGWVLPNVAILDVYGLNDAVVARHPVPSADERVRKLEADQGAIFALLDKDGDGGLSFEELQPAFAQLWPTLQGQDELRDGGVRDFVRRSDVDGDGKLARGELFPQQLADRSAARRMGHERSPPPGYIEGFRPNVRIVEKRAVVDAREAPLTDEAIRAHEVAARAAIAER